MRKELFPFWKQFTTEVCKKRTGEYVQKLHILVCSKMESCVAFFAIAGIIERQCVKNARCKFVQS
jgi:hypothetical protein